ncbi:hypothetical protein [Celeribacter halophilus]|uniref:hypothetical protein n=1 Tax=Celeribacter halophilus TaxID=576117 RepID=UPI002FD1D695
MAERRMPLYLARASYRRRRLIDALRLLPFLMFGLWLLPLLWGGEGTNRPLGAGSRAFVHVFVVWALGLIACAWLARYLRREAVPPESITQDETVQEAASQGSATDSATDTEAGSEADSETDSETDQARAPSDGEAG